MFFPIFEYWFTFTWIEHPDPDPECPHEYFAEYYYLGDGTLIPTGVEEGVYY